MISLRRQLWSNGVLSILGLALMLWLSGRWLLQQGLYQQVGGRLAHDAETLLGGLTWSDGKPRLLQPAPAGVYEQPRSGHYFVILLDDGSVLRSRSLWDEQLPVSGLPVGSTSVETDQSLAGQAVLLRRAGYSKQGHTVTIVMGEEIETVEEVMERLDIAFLVLTVLAVVLFMSLQGLAIRRILSPLGEVRIQLQQLAQGDRQAIDVAVPQEVQPLLDALNHLLSLVNERMLRSREALGNLAHALKTPLNLLQQDIATLPEGTPRESLQDASARIRTIIERELRHARIAGNAMGGEYFLPEKDLSDLGTVLQRLYPAVSLGLDIESDCGQMPFDREDMLELVGNLLDNACKWAAKEVGLELKCHDEGGLLITVRDDGPGIPEGRLQELLARGRRLDEQVEGHGLGLSIIAGIVESYRGVILAAPADAGGAGVTVRLPFPASVRTGG